MAWTNRYEIDEYAHEFKSHVVLGPGAKYLLDFRDLIDSISDGWAYWSHGTKCASDLIEILEKAHNQKYNHLRDNDFSPTRGDIVKACGKIERFMKSYEKKQETKYDIPVLGTAVQKLLF